MEQHRVDVLVRHLREHDIEAETASDVQDAARMLRRARVLGNPYDTLLIEGSCLQPDQDAVIARGDLPARMAVERQSHHAPPPAISRNVSAAAVSVASISSSP